MLKGLIPRGKTGDTILPRARRVLFQTSSSLTHHEFVCIDIIHKWDGGRVRGMDIHSLAFGTIKFDAAFRLESARESISSTLRRSVVSIRGYRCLE